MADEGACSRRRKIAVAVASTYISSRLFQINQVEARGQGKRIARHDNALKELLRG